MAQTPIKTKEIPNAGLYMLGKEDAKEDFTKLIQGEIAQVEKIIFLSRSKRNDVSYLEYEKEVLTDLLSKAKAL